MYAELGACLGNGCLYLCGIGCMFGERLFAFMWNQVHVWGAAVCMYAGSGARLRSWVHVWGTVLGLPVELGACLEAGCFPNPQAGPSPGPWVPEA